MHSLTGLTVADFCRFDSLKELTVTVKLFFATLVLHSFLRARIREAPREIPSTKQVEFAL